MAIHPFQSEAISRGARMLHTAFGPAIARFLQDPAIIEVMLNPDGRLWIDRLSGGLAETTERLSAPDGERIVRLVAHHVGAEVHAGSPRVSAELPETGERFEGLLPPVVAAPAFAIRKPAVAVFTLEDYGAAGIMTLGPSQRFEGRGRSTQEHTRGWRHVQRQDDASPMRCWPKSPRRRIGLFLSKTRGSFSARPRISWRCVPRTA